ncbi:MBL fold metallo-hydrolase [Streptomyces sp. ERV7]|uniref:MBL fold metallo-hydrolase n=1 Tax=Streptomyces sp. ERV7 TaxID=1322334 RepID=UPI0007F4D481|nr:MBL fold metallo-hydrolase [Streptomyces sp. ERV7]OAR26578.1 MBL fold metallo-hydrolase [Streptomyces sp. ERV7]
MRIPSELVALDDQVHAWLPQFPGTWGMANCVVVTSGTETLLVDTPYTAPLTRALAAAARRVAAPGARVSTVVNTHANGDHSYGNGLFPDAEIISTDANLAHLCAEPTPGQLQAMLDACRTEVAFERYLLAHFGRYDYTGLEVAPPTRTFSGRLDLLVGSTPVELYEVGPAHTVGDLIVHLPHSGVVCAGDVLFIDDVPVHWAGPLSGVVEACRRILELDPRVVVPGHGPLVGQAEVRAYMAYMEELSGRLHELHGAGVDVEEASRVLLREHRRPGLGLGERLAVLTAVEYRHLERVEEPLSLVEVLASAVRLAPDCVPEAVASRRELTAGLAELGGPASPPGPRSVPGDEAAVLPGDLAY